MSLPECLSLPKCLLECRWKILTKFSCFLGGELLNALIFCSLLLGALFTVVFIAFFLFFTWSFFLPHCLDDSCCQRIVQTWSLSCYTCFAVSQVVTHTIRNCESNWNAGGVVKSGIWSVVCWALFFNPSPPPIWPGKKSVWSCGSCQYYVHMCSAHFKKNTLLPFVFSSHVSGHRCDIHKSRAALGVSGQCSAI